MSTSPADLLEHARALLAEVVAVPATMLTDEELCEFARVAEDVGRLVDASRVTVAAELEKRSRFELGSGGLAYRLGMRRGLHLVEHLTRASQAECARRIALGGSVRARAGLTGQELPADFPHVAAAVRSGSVGIDAAAVVIRCLAQSVAHGADLGDVAAAESDLMTSAAHESTDSVAIMARAWREALDPDGAKPREEALRQRRGFRLGRERDGMTPFSGACDPTSAAVLRAVFSESNAPDVVPRFLCEEDRARVTTTESTTEGDVVTSIRDPRSREQRQLDVLIGLLTAGTRSSGQGPTAMVTAVIRLEDLVSGTGVGWIDDIAEPVCAETVRELACDAGFRTLLLGHHGEVLNLGRTERYFTQLQRRALAARDGGCVWPQCTAPPSWCHAHHVEEWIDDGLTDIDNGALLCPAHHHMLHASEFTMKMINGRPHLLAPPDLDPARQWRVAGGSRVAWAPNARAA